MARVVIAAASSHAFALMEPGEWDTFRAWNRRLYAQRYGQEPPEHPKVAEESDADVRYRYASIREGLEAVRTSFERVRLDALLIIGDDQEEQFSEENRPQLALYLGRSFTCSWTKRHYICREDLAWHLYVRLVEAGFDVSACWRFPQDLLKAHAFGPLLHRVLPAGIPVIPIFVEAIHVPAPTPRRCYEFGRAIRAAVETWDQEKRIGVLASGGLSHFTAGYPYRFLSRNSGFSYGSIDEDFDRWVLHAIAEGEGEKLAALTSEALLEHGEIELRSWLVILGVVGAVRPRLLVYQPFYRALMGMGIALWLEE